MHPPHVLAPIALGLLLVACAPDDSVFQTERQCTVADGAGNLYAATRLDMMAALETAMTRCSVDADDPASCLSQGCRDVR